MAAEKLMAIDEVGCSVVQPKGWYCKRLPHHDGSPCALVPYGPEAPVMAPSWRCGEGQAPTEIMDTLDKQKAEIERLEHLVGSLYTHWGEANPDDVLAKAGREWRDK